MRYARIACLSLAGLEPVALPQSSPARIERLTILAEFHQPYQPALEQAAREELGRIYSGLPIALEWYRFRTGDTSPLMERAVIARITGSCDAAGAAPPKPVLGLAHTAEGEVLPFIEASCDAVRSLAGGRLASVELVNRPSWIGRALGRILAHEIYHVLGGTVAHAARGVAKRTFTVDDLTRRKFAFDRATAKKLALTLRPPTAAESAAGPTRSRRPGETGVPAN